ncbi:winged helix DNA-binding domain-containing protein [Agromyces sp. MMS24-K17]|uniref:winged helix DNA-binding domain-containing protein n=1 Tax=Agromyces sp. MMS24-K17 TaxID=3372850 RepID=UPI0037551D72
MATASDVSRLRAARLAAHGLAGGGLPSITAAVERLGAVQAQDLGAAKWVLGARVAGAREADVDAAIESRAIVRTWPLRGTLHLMPAALVRPVLALTAPREFRRLTTRHRDLGLDAAVVAEARRIVVAELAARTRTRDELFAAWEGAGIATGGQRGYHLVWRFALEALVCCGPVDGRTQSFVLLDEWAPGPPAGAGDDARDETLTRLLTAYATGHGPVTVADFAWWAGLTLGDARRARAVAGEALAEFDAERLVAVGAEEPARAAAAAAARPGGRLALAAFDEYFLGYADRSVVCAPDDARKVVPGGNGVFQPILVDRGWVTGTWRRRDTRGGTSVTLEGFGDAIAPGGYRRALEAWAAFRGVPLLALEAADG